MLRKLTTSLALFSLFFSGVSGAEPLYWKASKGEKELMILGSVHMGKPEMYPLPETVMLFLNKSDSVILEIDMESSPPPQLSSAGQETSGQYLSTNQKEKLSLITAELGLPYEVMLSQPTWQTALFLQLTYFQKLGYQDKWGVDNYISSRARLKGIPIKGLETVDFQLSLFSGTKKVGRDLLDDTVNNWEKNKRIGQCLPENWLSGDKETLEELAEESAVSDELAASFIYDRNKNWAEQLNNRHFLPEKGKYLVVVGTLHLVGKQSLIQLLEERGFTVRQLSKSEVSDCK